jgi:formate hydrogenlyase subunit 3/multisubunit Na+/H+ antiporter MnhD subunit
VQVQLRRAPRFARFTGTGALLGLLFGLALVLLRPLPQLDVSLTAAVGYLAAIGGMVGALIGAALAVLADRLGRSRG